MCAVGVDRGPRAPVTRREPLGTATRGIEHSKPVPPLDGEALLDRQVCAFEQRPPVGPNGLLGEPTDRAGDLHRRLQRLAVLHDEIGQTDGECLLSIHRASRQNHLHGHAAADDPWKALSAAIDEWHTEAAFETAEDGRACRDTQVAPRSHLEAARHAVALDRSDGGLGHLGPGEPEEPLRAIDQVERLQVGTGGESAPGSVQHRHVDGFVCIEPRPGVEEGVGGFEIDGVSSLGTIDRDDSHAIHRVVSDGHSGCSLSASVGCHAVRVCPPR